MKKSKGASPRASGEPPERSDPVVRAVDDVVEDAIDEMVERMTGPDEAAAPVDRAGRKRVRHSFTMSKDEHRAIDALKTRLLDLSRPTRRSELLRAGVAALARMSDARLLAAIAVVPSLGKRPKGTKRDVDRRPK